MQSKRQASINPLKEAFEILNRGRALIKRPPFAWHPVLAAIAQELADYADRQYKTGNLFYYRDGHWQFLERAKRQGWVDRLGINPPDAKHWTGNRSEYGLDGQSDGDAPKDRDGWRHPTMPPEQHAKRVVDTLTSGMLPYNEGHVVDFRTSWTHAGIGYRDGFFIIDYGFTHEPVSVDDTPFDFY